MYSSKMLLTKQIRTIHCLIRFVICCNEYMLDTNRCIQEVSDTKCIGF